MTAREIFEKAGIPNVSYNVRMADYTTFRIGGPADVMARPANREELIAVFRLCRENGLRWFFLGNGSNLLVSDEGYRGVVICPDGDFNKIEVNGYDISAGCAASMSRIAQAALQAQLAGFEFASGIPGSFGGGIYMNAGAYGSELKDVLASIDYMDEEGFHRIGPDQARLGYRTSRFMTGGGIVLGGVVHLQPGSRDEIAARIKELAEQRRSKQPLEYPSAGSMYKRPQGYYAGKLIQDAGLAGFSVGGAQISEKHCGFVINTGGATCIDVRHLTQLVAEKVDDHVGVVLEPEVRYLGPEGLEPLLEERIIDH